MLGENATTTNAKNIIVYTVRMLDGQGRVNMNALKNIVNLNQRRINYGKRTDIRRKV